MNLINLKYNFIYNLINLQFYLFAHQLFSHSNYPLKILLITTAHQHAYCTAQFHANFPFSNQLSYFCFRKSEGHCGLVQREWERLGIGGVVMAMLSRLLRMTSWRCEGYGCLVGTAGVGGTGVSCGIATQLVGVGFWWHCILCIVEVTASEICECDVN